MSCFPQLATGALAQYPFERARSLRSIVNHTLDGGAVKLADPQAGTVSWKLTYRGLTDAEAAAITALFAACEGRFGSFLFLDPADNLLSWSEDFSHAIWNKDPLLQFSTGIADPGGLTRATRVTNTAQTWQWMEQILAVPAGFQYCFSLRARASAPAALRLRRTAGSAVATEETVLHPDWRLVQSAGNLNGSGNEMRFAIGVPAGGVVDLYGIQVDAQSSASPYRQTTANSGVYPDARFDDDSLSIVADAPGESTVSLRVMARTQG